MTNDLICIPYRDSVLQVRMLRHTSPAQRGTVLYLHGGGLVFGSRDDLPEPYIRMIRAAGYTLLMPDYPLAPETQLSGILDALFLVLKTLLRGQDGCGPVCGAPYILFGRSAGAYLSLQLTARLLHLADEDPGAALPLPKALLCFYGYHSFALPEFEKPSAYFRKLAPVSAETAGRLAGGSISPDGRFLFGGGDFDPPVVTEGPLAGRYSLYIYARQQGCWPRLVGAADPSFTIPDTLLKRFPPGFFTASTGDMDVPFRESRLLARLIPGSLFVPVYYLEHDFDRDCLRQEGTAVYTQALSFLDEQLRTAAEAASAK